MFSYICYFYYSFLLIIYLHIIENNIKTNIILFKINIVIKTPILDNISNTRADFNIAKVNIDELRDLAIDYEVEVVPTLLIFKNGKVVGRIEGLVSEEEIVNKVQECK